MPEEISMESSSTIFQAMSLLNKITMKRQGRGFAIVVDGDGKLLGTITDGDIRRAFLSGVTPESSIQGVYRKSPIVVPQGTDAGYILQLMRINAIIDIPVVDAEGRVLYVECLEGDINKAQPKLVAVIMAGGEGLRLRPLTESRPKPMLLVAGKPILQIIIESLRNFGFKRIIVSIRYLGHIIEEYFRDGSDFGVKINYIREEKPLGTAGSLSIIPEEDRPDNPFIVVNGDIMTALNFKAFRDFHIATNYDLTLCGQPYEVRIPFGYPIITGDVVSDFQEKPMFVHLVNAGIYCMMPEIFQEIPENERFDMPDLIKKIIASGKRVGVFPLRERLHEIGRHRSYVAAEEFYKNHLLPQYTEDDVSETA